MVEEEKKLNSPDSLSKRYNQNQGSRRQSPKDRFGKKMGKTRITNLPDSNKTSRKSEPKSPPRINPRLKPEHKTTLFQSFIPFQQRKESKSSDYKPNHSIGCGDDGGGNYQETTHHKSSKPQHLKNEEKLQHYQIVYRGVVSLLSEPSIFSKKSGAYVAYGEIIATSRVLTANGVTSPELLVPTDNQNLESSSFGDTTTDKSTTTGKIIRVDRVLTGGYAIDAVVDVKAEAVDQTPKRANTQPPLTVINASPMPISDSFSASFSASYDQEDTRLQTLQGSTNNEVDCHGYIFSQNNKIPIAIPIDVVPKMEYSSFLYKVVASTPIPILTGPSLDAPITKGMLIPGSTHEVCLRIYGTDNSISFLRLTRRRGWVADQKISTKNTGESRLFYVMKDITDEESEDDPTIISSSSNTSSIISTPISAARRRHRPPRRKREMQNEMQSHPPLHVMGPSAPNNSNSRHTAQNNRFDMIASTNSVSERGIRSPISNVSSLLSDESSQQDKSLKQAGSFTPDRSVARSAASSTTSQSFFLMRVNAPRGLKILDAPHFQVNNLIHGNNPGGPSAASPNGLKDFAGQSSNQSIFHTMAGHHTTTLTSKMQSPAVFDSVMKARKLPRGSVFEASKRMEMSGAFGEGAGLIKLSDNSGWAIVPKQDDLDEQYKAHSGALPGITEGEASRAFEEVGDATVDNRRKESKFLRIYAKGGLSVSCPPLPSSISDDDDTSPTSPGSSMAGSSNAFSQVTSQGSDVASSVGSSFIEAMMFRTPKKKGDEDLESRRGDLGNKAHNPIEKIPFSTVIPCGMCVEVEPWTEAKDTFQFPHGNDFARIRGGQGWVPRFLNNKAVVETIEPPDFRFGSFWFRVQKQDGIKVRMGPARRAPSIKSEEGVYFRFECGEFLRASEVVTFMRKGIPSESYAKLYRNRHVRLHSEHGEVRLLASLTAQSEWVQIFGSEQYLEECTTEPRIERHRHGWRYNIVLDARIQVRRGPSFDSDPTGAVLLGGESVLVNERVIGPDENVTWLRLKDGQGWVHNIGRGGEALMIPHSMKHRKGTFGKQRKAGNNDEQEDIAYNTIIARLFHNDDTATYNT